MDLIIDLNNLTNNTLKTAIILHEMKKGHRVVGNVGFSLFEITIVNEEKINNIGTWNVSHITEMEHLFRHTPDFNSDISGWNTSRVTTMSFMFANCANFDKPIRLNTSRVTDMSFMFSGCYRFNNPVNLNTTSVRNMEGMFLGCIRFNHPVKFNTEHVTDMATMFFQCENFNQPVKFNTKNVTTMEAMFQSCSELNQSVIFNDVSSLTNMRSMFESCHNFNQPIAFNTISVTNMSFMFAECIRFNEMVDLNTRSVIDMSYMFDSCRVFNEKLDFDTENVQNMNYMFNACTEFNQNISGWDVYNVVSHTGIFTNCRIEDFFKPLFKSQHETQNEYDNRREAHLTFVDAEKKRSFFNDRLNFLTVRSALKKHYSKGEKSRRSAEHKIPKATNAEKTLFNNMAMRNITSFVGEQKFLNTDKKHMFSKTRKGRNSIGG